MSYEVNGKEYNMNSSKNQRIISKFVDREVYSNVTDMVEFILDATRYDGVGSTLCNEAPFNYEDITNLYVDNSSFIEEAEERLEELEEKREELDDKEMILDEKIEDLESELEDIGDKEERLELENKINSLKKDLQAINTEQDVLFADIDELEDEIQELKDKQDEPNEVYSWYIVSPWLCSKLESWGEVVIESENLWGRGTCGQSISLDWVIGCICKNMEILEGQKYEWEV